MEQGSVAASRFHSIPSCDDQHVRSFEARNRIPVQTTRIAPSLPGNSRRSHVCPSCDVSTIPAGPTAAKIPAP
jgi:hypothetical protein